MQPPDWKCDNCGQMNYAPKSMTPDQYEIYLKDKEIKKDTKKYNL